jgi:hypothetical protein
MQIPGATHHAEHETLTTVEYTCACGYRARARARAVGTGSARNPLFLDGAATDRAAQRRAVRDALNRAEDLLQIVRCPKCARRNPAGVLSFVAWSVLPALGLGFMAFMGVGLSWGMVAGVVGAVVAATLYLGRRYALWGRADQDVEFMDSPERLPHKRRPASPKGK